MRLNQHLQGALAHVRKTGNKKAEHLILRIEALHDQAEMAVKNADKEGFFKAANGMVTAMIELVEIITKPNKS